MAGCPSRERGNDEVRPERRRSLASVGASALTTTRARLADGHSWKPLAQVDPSANRRALTMYTRGMFKGLRRRFEMLVYTRGTGRICPLCGWEGDHFLRAGAPGWQRPDARCPQCDSLERHRLAYLRLQPELPSGQLTLHVAPEPTIQHWLESISDDYLSIDLDGQRAMQAMDITALPLEDACRTLVYCSDVLEHVPDDAAAIREMRRVLTPTGHAVVQTPVWGEVTDEDLSVTDKELRRSRFGQADHVRVYGMDIVERLRRGGFAVETLDADDLPSAAVTMHSLGASKLFRCRPV